MPRDLLMRFLRQRTAEQPAKILLVSVAGAHAHGYAHPNSPLELKGLHVESTEKLLALVQPPRSFNWVGEFEGLPIDYSSLELGPALKRLLSGDGLILERILAPQQLLRSHDVQRLQRITEAAVSRRFYNFYRTCCRTVLQREDEGGAAPRRVAHLLGVYRMGLTGVHLLRSGELIFDLAQLAQTYGLAQLTELITLNREQPAATLPEGSPWINRLVRLSPLLETAFDDSSLPPEPANPEELEEYLMDMRRRFFDALTVAQG